MMISLDYSPRAVCLASFYNIRHLAVDFKREILPIFILKRPHSNILKRNYALWYVLRGVLKVIQTSIVQNEPPPLPTFPAPSLNNGKKLNMSEMMNAQRCMAVRSETVLTPILQA